MFLSQKYIPVYGWQTRMLIKMIGVETIITAIPEVITSARCPLCYTVYAMKKNHRGYSRPSRNWSIGQCAYVHIHIKLWCVPLMLFIYTYSVCVFVVVFVCKLRSCVRALTAWFMSMSVLCQCWTRFINIRSYGYYNIAGATCGVYSQVHICQMMIRKLELLKQRVLPNNE